MMKKLFSFLIIFVLTTSFFGRNPHKKKVIYLLHSPSEDHGLFAAYNIVIGLLNKFVDGNLNNDLVIDFQDKGLYYDKELEKNWWEYYFEPMPQRNDGKGRRIIVDWNRDQRIGNVGLEGHLLPRKRAAELIKKYIIVKPHILEKVSKFQDKNFQGFYVIGVHYRGTDKFRREAPFVPLDVVKENIEKITKNIEQKNVRIFVATDDSNFLDQMKDQYQNQVLYTKAFRAEDGQPIHFRNMESNYKKGEEALIDCLLLSHCDFLIKTSSNLSSCAAKMNPEIPVISLNRSPWEPKDFEKF